MAGKHLENQAGRVITPLLVVASGLDSSRGYQSMLGDVVAAGQEPRSQGGLDPVTGLPDRAALLAQMGRTLSGAGAHHHTGVLVIEVEDFRLVTDAYGHQAGDELLRTVAEVIAGGLRSSDSLAHIFGTTFAVVCLDLARPGAVDEVAARLEAVLSRPVEVAGREMFAATRIGTATATGGAMSAEELLRRAGVASSATIGADVQSARFTDALDQQGLDQLQLTTDLHRALLRDELLLHYQPQVRIDTGQVVAVEALVRWQHPDRGLLAPDRFIPLAERTGLIPELDAWVLREACRQFAVWQEAGSDVPRIAVNLAPSTLLRSDLLGEVEEALTSHGLLAHQLELELTERGMIRNPALARELMRQLRALGVRLAIDDFGSGYSSLSQLQQFEFNTMKIDRSLVSRLSEVGAHAPSDVAVVKAVVVLADHLGLDLVVEGVETSLQRDYLRHLGCRVAQGFLYCAPVPAVELRDLLIAVGCWSGHRGEGAGR